MKGQNRSDVKPGKVVGIITDENQITGIITEGVVAEIITKSLYHPHGIKVRLATGEIGRVKTVKPGAA
ncbi:MAG: YwbE family protein [Bacteroidota bacterium]|nr:YwbE family protein [Bacteroidota bacterium]